MDPCCSAGNARLLLALLPLMLRRNNLQPFASFAQAVAALVGADMMQQQLRARPATQPRTAAMLVRKAALLRAAWYKRRCILITLGSIPAD
jgi:hypothetical protein